MNADVPRLVVGVDEVAYESMAVAIEVDADELARAVEHGTTGVAADRVRGRDEIERRLGPELVLHVEPAFGQIERMLIFLLLGASVHLIECRGVAELDAVD